MKTLLKFNMILVIFICQNLFAYTTVSGNVSGQTWTSGTYYVSGTITVNQGFTLTINPGVTVKFANGTLAYIYGTLDAIGLSGSNIVFTSMHDNSTGETIDGSNGTPVPGSWYALNFDGSGTYNGIGHLDYCDIKYGGGYSSYPGGIYVYVSDSFYIRNSTIRQSSRNGLSSYSSSPEIDNCVFSTNTMQGIHIDGGTPIVTNNTFTGNTLYAAYLTGVNTTAYSGNGGSGNGKNGMRLSGNVTVNQTWSHDPAFPFIIGSNIYVNDDKILTFAPQTVIKGEQYGYFVCNGSINSVSTSGNEIIFTSFKDDNYGGDTNGDGTASSPAPGDWYGFNFSGESSYEGVGTFEYTIIKYGGGYSSAPGNIYSYYSDSFSIKNCYVSNSLRNGLDFYGPSPTVQNNTITANTIHGLYCDGGAPAVNSNSFTGNTQYAAYLNGVTITSYSGNTGSGNGKNGLRVSGNVTSDQTWTSESGFPIILGSNVYVNDEMTLTFSPNTVIKGEQYGNFVCYGSINSVSTTGNDIIFTSVKDDNYGGDTNGDGSATLPAPGDWYGFNFDGGGAYNGIGNFEYSIIKYGGGYSSSPGNIHSYYSDSFSIKNCYVSNSLRNGLDFYGPSPTIQNNTITSNTIHGLYCDGGAPAVNSNSFTGNTQYAVYLNTVTVTSYSGNTGSGNGKNGMRINGSVTSNQIISSEPGFPFIIGGTVYINDNQTLTIDENTVLKGEQTGYFNITGTLVSDASAGNEIIFTSVKDDTFSGDTNGDGSATLPASGDWYGFHFDGSGEYDGKATIDYTIIKYGGGYSSYPANIDAYYPDNLTVSNSLVSNSVRHGLYLYGGSSTAITGNTISGNTFNGLYATGGTPVITGNTFTNNLQYAADLSSVTPTAYSGNSGSGNGKNGMRLNCTVSSDLSWSHGTNFPFIITGNLYISDERTLTLAPGTVIKGEPASRIAVYGTLQSPGTSGSGIIYTSLKDDSRGGDTNGDGNSTLPSPGDWDGFYFEGNGTNNGIGNFEYSQVYYGGRTGGNTGNSNIYWNYSDSGYFRNSVTGNSQNTGLHVYYSKPELTSSTFTSNGTYGVHCNNSLSGMQITGNTFSTNGNHGLYLESSSLASIDNNIFNNNNGYGVYLNNLWLYSYTGNTGTGNLNNGFGIYAGSLWNLPSTWTSGSKDFPFIIVGSTTTPVKTLIQQRLLIGPDTTLKFNNGLGQMDDNGTEGHVEWSSGCCLWLNDGATPTYAPATLGVFIFDQRFWPVEWKITSQSPAGVYQIDEPFQGGTKVTIDCAGRVILLNNIQVTEELNLINGIIDGYITLGTSASNKGIFNYMNGYTIQSFTRWLGSETADDILFPVGSSDYFSRPVNLSFTSAPATGGTVTVRFNDPNPGTNGLPLSDAGSSITDVSMAGYWSVTSGNGLSGGTYDLDITASGFPGIVDYQILHLLKRTDGTSPWTAAGSHITATGTNSNPTLHRKGLSSFSEFGAGTEGVFDYTPKNFSVATATGSSVLTWDHISGASDYYVYRSSDPYASFPSGWTLHAIVHRYAGDTSYTVTWTDTDGILDKRFYRVTAVY